MRKSTLYAEDGYLPSKAKKVGCEAIYIPGEDDSSPGEWTFHQNYDQGVVWKRLVLPWIALPSDQKGNDTPIKAFSRQLKTAEAYLRDAFPGAQIPQNLLKEHLFDSVKELDGRNSNQNQGELLGLGITRRTWNLKTGRKRKDNRWHELFVAFPSGDMRSHISVASVQWEGRELEGGGTLRVPCLRDKCTFDAPFQQQIEQIVFPTMARDGSFNDFFAVRTRSQVSIFSCSRIGGGQLSLQLSLALPMTTSEDTLSGIIADMTFDTLGSKAIIITNTGYWAVYELTVRTGRATKASSGGIDISVANKKDIFRGWWKMEWIDHTEEVLIAERNGLHLLDTSQSLPLIHLDGCTGLTRLEGLETTAYGILTRSEIVIVDNTEWKVVLRQKHRRDLDTSLSMKTFFEDNITNILLYSRLNAVITVHQIVQDIALSWADTPFLLSMSRSDPNFRQLLPNLGLVIIPSESALNNPDSEDLEESNSFMTYRIVSDLSIVGDMYAKEVETVHDLTKENSTGNGRRRKLQGLEASNRDEESEERDEDWALRGSNSKLDFMQIGNNVLPAIPAAEMIPNVSLSQLKREILHKITNTDSLHDTLLPQKSPSMLSLHPDTLTSMLEQIAHQLEENGLQIKHLNAISPQQNDDPEDDPGSISWIYRSLLSSLPRNGLTANDIRTKERLFRETAVDVGLSNVGVFKSSRTTKEEIEPLNNLKRFMNIDPGVSLPEATKYLLDKWDDPNHIEQPPTETTKTQKRKRVQLPISQQEPVVVQDTPPRVTRTREGEMAEMITMSQPERGRHGVRNLRPRTTRRSGF